MDKLGVIIVGGAGEIAVKAHIPSWLKNSKVNVLALVDPNEEKMKGICKSFGIKRYYTSLEEALDKEKDVEIVDLATPTKFHYPHAILSLNERKHVIIEKPMASNSEECKEIIDLAKKNDLKVSIFHTFKGYPIVWKIKELINKGELGEKTFISFSVSYGEESLQSWWKGVKTAIIHEFGIHRIYTTSYWLEGIKDVKISVHSKEDDGMIKDATVFLYGNKGLSEISIFKNEKEILEEIRIFGDDKKIILSSFLMGAFQKIETAEKRDFRKMAFKELKKLLPPLGMIRTGLNYLLYGKKMEPHYTISSNFVNSILHDEDLIVTPEEGLEAIEILEKLDELCRDL